MYIAKSCIWHIISGTCGAEGGILLSMPNLRRKRQKEKKREAVHMKKILEMANHGLEIQRKYELEHGWQYVCGNSKIFDKTPFEAVCDGQ